MRITGRSIAAVAAVVLAIGLTAGCTVSNKSTTAKAGSGSIKQISALKGVQLKVGSKEFDEQLVLGQIAIEALQAAGASPVDKTNITGSDNVRKALTTGQIDLYWEYTGTGWVSFLKQTSVVTDPVKLYDDVKSKDAANNITWWARAPGNDTYAIAANPTAAKKYNISSLSDYAKLAKSNPSAASICLGQEFSGRDDGFPGVEKHYGFTVPSSAKHVVNDSAVYPAVGKGSQCSFGSVSSTDGRILANKLVVLKDDKNFFPIYNPAITIRTSVAQKYPQLEAVFQSIADKLTTDTLTALNKKISVDGESASKVASDWMKSEGFIS